MPVSSLKVWRCLNCRLVWYQDPYTNRLGVPVVENFGRCWHCESSNIEMKFEGEKWPSEIEAGKQSSEQMIDHMCEECKSNYQWPMHSLIRPTCPFCNTPKFRQAQVGVVSSLCRVCYRPTSNLSGLCQLCTDAGREKAQAGRLSSLSPNLKPPYELTSVQQGHVYRIKEDFCRSMESKYRKGAEEHGGVIHEVFGVTQLLECAMEEVIDLYVYLQTLREKLVGKGGPCPPTPQNK